MSHVVVRFNGGMGNQMFQYALGRKLMTLGHTVRFDLSFFEQGPGLHVQRPYSLDVFNAKVEKATPADIRSSKHQGSTFLALLAALHPRLAAEHRYMEHADYTFDPLVLQLERDTYLDGYWQTEKYFADIASIIRQDLNFSAPFETVNAEVAERIARVQSVSIHVRRGDYVTHPAAQSHFVTCGPQYYSDAVQVIMERVPDAHFFLFSDDIGWARENIRTVAPLELVDHNTGANSFEDMRLMALCKHHIIANSSFSWWGAWLNARQARTVIAPRHWLRDGRSTHDLIPSDWILR